MRAKLGPENRKRRWVVDGELYDKRRLIVSTARQKLR
jgi:hypothetical protein